MNFHRLLDIPQTGAEEQDLKRHGRDLPGVTQPRHLSDSAEPQTPSITKIKK